MTLVVDASLAMRWLIQSEDSARARALIGAESLVAPDLIMAEVANALWRHTAAGHIKMEAGKTALAALSRTLDQIHPNGPLATAAYDLACALGHAAYDCFYLVLAEQVNGTVVTADRKLAAKVEGTDWANRVRLL